MLFNSDFFKDIEAVKARYATSVIEGKQVADSSWPSLAYHDGCHGIEAFLCGERYSVSASELKAAWESGEVATEIIDEAYNRLRRMDSSVPDLRTLMLDISEYATKDESETICEAARDIRVNGDKAKPLSKAIVEVMKEQLNGKR